MFPISVLKSNDRVMGTGPSRPNRSSIKQICMLYCHSGYRYESLQAADRRERAGSKEDSDDCISPTGGHR